ncbi:MAG TPA: hypothetical protein VNJ01_05815 [Bacteriovoracaceae bacterium]|nr:hypothetical protein [Bacteriovoracaceae bacterium]
MFFSFLGKMIRTQRGFNLIELMIGGTILAGAGITATVLFSKNMAAQKGITHLQDLQSYHTALTKTFSDTRNCNATFNMLAGPGQNPQLVDIDHINILAESANQDQNDDAFDGTYSAIPTTAIAREGVFIGTPDKSWKIETMDVVELPNTSANVSGAITKRHRMDITYIYPKMGEKPAQTSIKSIYFTAKFEKTASGPDFVGCHDIKKNSIENLENNLCETMTPPATSLGMGQLFEWDKAKQNCVRKTNVRNCPAGFVAKGYTENGTVDCVSLRTGYEGINIVSPNLCGTGTRVNLVFTSGRMGFRCQP